MPPRRNRLIDLIREAIGEFPWLQVWTGHAIDIVQRAAENQLIIRLMHK